MPKDMRTEKHHQNDFAILGRTYGVSPTCCLWNAVIFYHSGKALSSAFPENDNGICTFSGKTRKNQPSFAALTLMPGPMVEATTQLLI